jgi:hypothetical protein
MGTHDEPRMVKMRRILYLPPCRERDGKTDFLRNIGNEIIAKG